METYRSDKRDDTTSCCPKKPVRKREHRLRQLRERLLAVTERGGFGNLSAQRTSSEPSSPLPSPAPWDTAALVPELISSQGWTAASHILPPPHGQAQAAQLGVLQFQTKRQQPGSCTSSLELKLRSSQKYERAIQLTPRSTAASISSLLHEVRGSSPQLPLATFLLVVTAQPA